MNLLDTLTTNDLVSGIGCKAIDAENWLPYIKAVLPSFGIVTKERIAAFLSQCAVESAAFSTLSENLNYSAKGLATTWPVRYASKNLAGKYKRDSEGRYVPNAKAVAIARKPIAIANHCYANRMGNGDEASGDGWKFRGRGLKQLTGRSNYTMMSRKTGVDFVNEPDKLLEPVYALLSACVFWQENKLGPIADTGNITKLTKVVNGGANGLPQRKALYIKMIGILDARERAI